MGEVPLMCLGLVKGCRDFSLKEVAECTGTLVKLFSHRFLFCEGILLKLNTV